MDADDLLNNQELLRQHVARMMNMHPDTTFEQNNMTQEQALIYQRELGKRQMELSLRQQQAFKYSHGWHDPMSMTGSLASRLEEKLPKEPVLFKRYGKINKHYLILAITLLLVSILIMIGGKS